MGGSFRLFDRGRIARNPGIEVTLDDSFAVHRAQYALAPAQNPSDALRIDFGSCGEPIPRPCSRIEGVVIRKGGREDSATDLRVGRWEVQPALDQVRAGRAVRHLEPQVMDFLLRRPLSALLAKLNLTDTMSLRPGD